MKKYRFLILRRFVQLGLLALYFMANYAGWKLLQGNLSSSLLLEKVPLSDPFATLQLFVAGGALGINVIIGAFIIFFIYAIFAGRAFCSFVCPLNIVTDFANFLHRKFGINRLKHNISLSKNVRYWMIALSLILSAIFGIAAFEAISPIGMLHREIIFGAGFGLAIVFAIFLFDLFGQSHGFCGHICPVGGFYSLVGRFSFIKVKYHDEKCTKCMECRVICPENQVLEIVGKGESGFIVSGECTRCGRCVEVCESDALDFSIKSFVLSQKDKK
ncbi:MAG: quinol dehydrogenase ferredoxin subunit NapH [Campylobacteraceae bacterium]